MIQVRFQLQPEPGPSPVELSRLKPECGGSRRAATVTVAERRACRRARAGPGRALSAGPAAAASQPGSLSSGSATGPAAAAAYRDSGD
jgi:hypothetical protein